MAKTQKLNDLVSVGPAMMAVFEDLGITEVDHLIGKDARQLFEQLQQLKGKKIDRCCEDVFRTAIEQAADPNLPAEKRQWHYWSRKRKAEESN